jgi:hypothetical protein
VAQVHRPWRGVYRALVRVHPTPPYPLYLGFNTHSTSNDAQDYCSVSSNTKVLRLEAFLCHLPCRLYHHRGPHSIASTHHVLFMNPPPAPPPPDPSHPDDLQKYPLRIHSDICKATGSGWWTPKPSPIPDYMKRIPGHKAPYKIALEEEEETVWNAHANPVVTSRDAGTSL